MAKFHSLLFLLWIVAGHLATLKPDFEAFFLHNKAVKPECEDGKCRDSL